MSAAHRRWAAELLHFWFHHLRPPQWFGRNAALDAALRRRFARDLRALGNRPAQEFLSDPQTARAAVLLFDQIPRNLFRDDARAYAYDPLAREITKCLLERGWDRGLTRSERQFVLMPLMHSEVIADQRESLRRFAALGDPGPLAYARAHARIIARFGRFPHRNAVLGRRSSPSEDHAIREGAAW